METFKQDSYIPNLIRIYIQTSQIVIDQVSLRYLDLLEIDSL